MARRHTHWLFPISPVPNPPVRAECVEIPTHIENMTVQGFAQDVPPFPPGVNVTHKIWGFLRTLELNPSDTEGRILIATYEAMEDITTVAKYDHVIQLGAMRFELIGVEYSLDAGVVSNIAVVSVQ